MLSRHKAHDMLEAHSELHCNGSTIFIAVQHSPAKLLAQALQGEQCPFARAWAALIIHGCRERIQNAIAIDGADTQALDHARQAQCGTPPVPVRIPSCVVHVKLGSTSVIRTTQSNTNDASVSMDISRAAILKNFFPTLQASLS